MIKVTSKSTCKNDEHVPLRTSDDLANWLREVPLDVELTPIMYDAGSQFDPNRIMVGLQATWDEER